MDTTGPISQVLERHHCLDTLEADIRRHIVTTLGYDDRVLRKPRYYGGLAFAVRDRLINLWLETQRSSHDAMAKRVYYLSMEFLPGRFLMNYLVNMQMLEGCRTVIEDMGFTMEDLEEEEWDAGLGNGGLGRLASCYMDSMATLRIPGYGYGLMYDYGIFHQLIVNGMQQEQADNWRRTGSPWEIKRRASLYDISFHGRSEAYRDEDGNERFRWVETEHVMAMPCDILIPGYGTDHVNNMRLWAAQSSLGFDLEDFNRGDYIGAMEHKVISENLTKVLYPNDQQREGKELRLKQQYFMVAATFRDILRRHIKHDTDIRTFPDLVAVQLNDTHPAIAVPEFMRILMDEHMLEWDEAWEICTKTFAYTNHTVLPEALETWPVELIGRVLPRHMQIIFEINRRFLEQVEKAFPGDTDRLRRMSIIGEDGVRHVRMAHLAIAGSHTVNGVAALHSDIIKKGLFKDFDELYPNKLTNVTNGVTPRRWILQANPTLSHLITEKIGPDWVTDLDQLRKLEPFAEDAEFRKQWAAAKLENKKRFARYVLRKLNMGINPRSMFDVQVKRMHEYKRQLLNVLHAVTLYNRIKADPEADITPRTIMIGGKAAPGYFIAKLTIRLITSVAGVINTDPDVRNRLRLLFLPNYCISQAEKVIPAADLSEQISTAGMEASGTGNMKFAMNGALTIGTLDGANVEIMEEVGEDNIFIFGLTAEEVEARRRNGHDPNRFCDRDPELRHALRMIGSGTFSPDDPDRFQPILDSIFQGNDWYLVTADYRPYVDMQDRVAKLYSDTHEWTRKSILNTARMGKFSSDRSVGEYAERIWNTPPLGK